MQSKIYFRISVACCAGVFWTRECIFSYLGRHLGFGNCGGLGRGNISRGSRRSLPVPSISISGYLFPVMRVDEKQPKQSRVGQEKLGLVIWRHEIFCKAAILKRAKFTQKVHCKTTFIAIFLLHLTSSLHTSPLRSHTP